MTITYENLQDLVAAMRSADRFDVERHESDCLRGNTGPIAPYAEAIARNPVLFHAVELRRAEIQRSGFNGEALDAEYEALSRRDDAERAEVYGQQSARDSSSASSDTDGPDFVTRDELVALFMWLKDDSRVGDPLDRAFDDAGSRLSCKAFR